MLRLPPPGAGHVGCAVPDEPGDIGQARIARVGRVDVFPPVLLRARRAKASDGPFVRGSPVQTAEVVDDERDGVVDGGAIGDAVPPQGSACKPFQKRQDASKESLEHGRIAIGLPLKKAQSDRAGSVESGLPTAARCDIDLVSHQRPSPRQVFVLQGRPLSPLRSRIRSTRPARLVLR